MKIKLLMVFMTALLLVSMTNTAVAEPKAEKNNDNVDVETEDLFVSITGNQNVPKFTFGANRDNAERYSIQFSSILEVVDENNNTEYDLGEDSKVAGSSDSLSSYKWDS